MKSECVKLVTIESAPWRSLRGAKGFSLLELLLVLAILSTIIAISWPSLSKPLSRSRAQSAARKLQGEILSARLLAMDSGATQVFQFRAGTADYYIGTRVQTNADQSPGFEFSDKNKSIPIEENFSEAAESDSLEKTRGNQVDKPGSEDLLAEDKTNRQLPDGVIFSRVTKLEVAGEQEMPGRMEEGDARVRISNKQPQLNDEWSAPIRLYPSGRMTPGSLELISTDGYDVTIEIHGLTARVMIGELRKTNRVDAKVLRGTE